MPGDVPPWPPTAQMPAGPLAWRSGMGRFLWDGVENAPAPHIRRWRGTNPVIALDAGRERSFTHWIAAGGKMGRRDARPFTAVRTLWEWIATRPRLVNGILRGAIDRPEGSFSPVGFYVRFDLPGAERIDTDFDETRFRTSFHGTALEVLHRIVVFAVSRPGGLEILMPGGSCREFILSRLNVRIFCRRTYCTALSTTRGGCMVLF